MMVRLLLLLRARFFRVQIKEECHLMSELKLVISGLADSLCLHTYPVINCFCVTIMTHKLKPEKVFFFVFFTALIKLTKTYIYVLKGHSHLTCNEEFYSTYENSY